MRAYCCAVSRLLVSERGTKFYWGPELIMVKKYTDLLILVGVPTITAAPNAKGPGVEGVELMYK